MQLDCGMFLCGPVQYATQISTFEHLAQKSVILGWREIERSRFQAIADPDLLNRAAFANQGIAKPDCFE